MKSVWCFISVLAVLIGSSLSQSISDANQKTVQNGLLSFGIKLNSILLENSTENKNILFSPYNLYTALALVHLGGNGTTRDTISKVLDIPITLSSKSLQKVLQNFSSVLQTSFTFDAFFNGTMVKASDLKLANGIFVQNEYNSQLKKEYVADVQLYHNSDIFNVDFVNKGEETKDTINNYISNKTENRIPRLLEDPLSKDTLIVLTTSLYFKSVWHEKFNPELTKAETFQTDKGNITVQMMNSIIKAGYANIPSLGVEVVNLRFIDTAFSMFVGMPRENQSLDNFLRNLTSDQIHTMIGQSDLYSDFEVDLKLPKTAFKWSKSVKDNLTKLGLKEEFWRSPDLSNMIDQSNIQISDIGHSTDIKINEDGTEASAVSIVTIDWRSEVQYERRTFHVNRPFFFFIYNHNIKTVLFFGTVFNPGN
ncbi:leukocyte elastase inhibitor-like [Planococcus citri]|uniref:leukocyte elastase inhibitor-like n=1 Tax=Planococcus citri TaxID=170843 RepID=UPI0031F7A8CE